mmetsp:Transcript_746/g.1088  ORF Transcript_746/g.1088 Transcript_746/m.1088 type:complete len:156 (-) Transcript_746:38-505(-)|eukprot:CAMPEP_0171457166 /NCGR_PEP_ID=MMETSP0945-20130129/3355_1 /TAXON_ID=109269 /ORGANISM="Vaucheria litorea, Strain CCMP2940" /LENGTH=155 /DNA_ID=CAMNT_0011982723 /DNA_START=110 /DNA_END=577 /DNA_ORIENTATION=-
MKFSISAIILSACGIAQAFVPSSSVKSHTQLSMSAKPVDRISFIKSAAAVVGAVSFASPALAEIDNPIVPFLGGGDKVDINNANIRAYIKLPGMYPGTASKIVSNGPYKTVSDLYSIKGLSDVEKATLKKYEDKFVIFEQQPMYGIDRINNGLYR